MRGFNFNSKMPQSKKLCFIITREGIGWATKTLCTQKEANSFSLWNYNLGYQGILEHFIKNPVKHILSTTLISITSNSSWRSVRPTIGPTLALPRTDYVTGSQCHTNWIGPQYVHCVIIFTVVGRILIISWIYNTKEKSTKNWPGNPSWLFIMPGGHSPWHVKSILVLWIFNRPPPSLIPTPFCWYVFHSHPLIRVRDEIWVRTTALYCIKAAAILDAPWFWRVRMIGCWWCHPVDCFPVLPMYSLYVNSE
jgi:hypothetical protein